MKKNMPQLFQVDIVSPDEQKSTEFISKLQKMGFIGKNKVYLSNYINADLSIALSHIKQNYKRYVLNGTWNEEKFLSIVLLIASERRMLIPNVFLTLGTQYDDGKLTQKIAMERRKYEEPDKVSSEDELLEYIRKHGGGN